MAKEIPPITASNPLSATKPISDVNTPTVTTSVLNSAGATMELPDLQALGSGIQYALVKSAEGDASTSADSHFYLLELANKQTLRVESNVSLTPGQMIAFQVTNSQLRLVATAANSETTLINQLINQLSSQQNSPVSSLALLQALVQSPNNNSQLLNLAKASPALAELAATLAQQLPELADLTKPETVKSSVANSGLFFENKLVSAGTTDELEHAFNSDLKALFGKISAEFKNNPALQRKLAEFSQSAPSGNTAGSGTKTALASKAEPVNLAAAEAELSEPLTTATGVSAYARVAAASTGNRNPVQPLLPQVPPPLPGASNMHFHPHMQWKGVADIGNLLFSLLFKNSQASLNRITLQQLSSSSHTEETENEDEVASSIRLNFDIPFIFQNSSHAINVRIEGEPEQTREKQQNKKKVNIWNVTLAFDLEFVGPMQIQLRINDKLANATIWAEREQTLNTTRNAVDELKTSLTNIGLNVTAIDCKAGLPTYKSTPLEHRLVDVKT